ncbi:MAG: hypothetical protein GZ091_05465 [Paludibacter sp.]|nr:hypothetical protein [Paludibacter sp.]
MKKKYTAIFLFLFSFANIGWCGKIIYPWRATTAIVKAGESFEVWFNADTGQTVNSVTLHGPYNTVATTKKIERGSWVYDVTSQNRYNTRITVTVPSKAPADRYDIILNTSNGQDTSLAGLKVIKKYKPHYYILHFSDAHAFQKGTETVLQRLSTIIEMANIINPELVFNTGDNLYRPTDDRMNQLFIGNNQLGTKGLNKLNAATFTVAGNHDIDFDNLPEEGFYKEKADWWNKWWGLQAYNFSYGKGRFMAFNNGWHGFKPVQQITAIDSWLQKEGAGNLRVGAAHIRNKEMNGFDSVANPGLILIGHNHHIASQNPSPLNNKPIQYIVNSVRDNMEFNLFKVDAKTGSYKAVGSTTAQVVYVENPTEKESPDLYKPRLTATYSNANDGTNATNTATITNKFDFPIESAKVRFILPFGKKYTISKGHIEQSFDGTSVHVVDVTFHLEPNSTTLIEIAPSR